MQSHASPPDYFVRQGNTTYQDDLFLRKRTRMRRWLCCTCQVEESYPSNENEHLKSPRNYGESEFISLIRIVYHLQTTKVNCGGYPKAHNFSSHEYLWFISFSFHFIF